ncbi:MAG: CCA tRNA nucleotidyltransferase [Anaerolineales bacterium]|nr:CCA tRNA nucleotidyltransferase [Anaerolineales bacterium]
MAKQLELISEMQSGDPARLPLKRALATLPAATRRLLERIVATAEGGGLPIYLVGGFVRDLFLGLPSLDLDLVLEGDAIRFGRKLVALYGGKLDTHANFRTAVWHLPPGKDLPADLDLISARRESYPKPAALPKVVLANLAADQARRDFTINTLALRLDSPAAGQLLDPFGGLDDLRRGWLRTLHTDSFVDDPTRMLRALRLAGRLGFRLEAGTQQQLRAHRDGLSLLSGARTHHELELTLKEERRAEVLAAMQRAGLLARIHPGLRLPRGAATALRDAAARKPPPAYWSLDADALPDLPFVLWLMWLPEAAVQALTKRLRFKSGPRAAALGAARLRARAGRLAAMRPSRLTAELEQEPLLAVYALWLSRRGTPLGDALQSYARRWRQVAPRTDGHALQRRGLPQGPAYARILAQLRAAWLDGEVRSARQETALLERLLKREGH